MANLTAERRGELVRGVFQILLDNPDGIRSGDLLEHLEDLVPPTEFEQSEYPNRPGVRRYEKIVRFLTIAPVKAGWMTKERGTWCATDEGRAAFERHPDPVEFNQTVVQLYRRWKQEQPEDEQDGDTGGRGIGVEEAEETAWAEIEEHLSKMPPYEFQDLIAGLLRGMGYHVSWVSPPGPDMGIDIVAHSDPLGIAGPRLKVQVKRQQQKITAHGLRSFMAVLGTTDVGLFVSLGGFTKDAEMEARTQESRRVMLVDMKRLFDFWVEHYASIPEEHRRLMPLRPVYFLAPEE